MSPLFLLLFAPILLQAPVLPLRIHTLHSVVFNNERSIRVLLPAGYDDAANANRRYPVLYLNDGQNLFDTTTAVFGPTEWQVDETVALLTSKGRIPALIVVGIDNGGRGGQRAHEYLPWADSHATPPGHPPEGNRYPDFLINEVMPLIQHHYRILTGPENTGLGGSSFGSLISLYTVLAKPGVFGRVLLESTSLWVDDDHALRMAAESKKWPDRVYIGVGTNEDSKPGCTTSGVFDAGMVDPSDSLAKLVASAKPAPKLQLVVEPCATHSNEAWARRLPGALTFLYGD